MRKIFLKITLLIFISFGFFSILNLNIVKAQNLERLFYFVDGENARSSLFTYSESIDIFAPQTYHADAEGNLKGSVAPELLSFANKNKIKVMPLLTNGAFSQSAGHTLLDSISAQKKLIQALITEAEKFDYWGWQIDFEQMELSYRDRFSEFIERIYKEFKKKDLQLSVAVIAQISERPEDYPKNLWQRIIGVYDYKTLAQNTDFVSIMSYDDPYSLGPVAGWAWYNKVLDFTLTQIPPEKISFGLGLYYWRWDDAAMKRMGIGGNYHLNNLMKEHKLKFYYDIHEQAPYFHYWSKGKSYTGWYENARSVGQKISLIKKSNLRGFSVWALGLELPSVYQAMK